MNNNHSNLLILDVYIVQFCGVYIEIYANFYPKENTLILFICIHIGMYILFFFVCKKFEAFYQKYIQFMHVHMH